MTSSSITRLQKELASIKKMGIPGFGNLEVDESNMLEWLGLIIPDKEPYNHGAYKIKISIPREYPFKPPLATFHTKIFHPSVEENGKMCFYMMAPEHWKPSTKLEDVIKALVDLVNNPNADFPMRADAAELFLKDKDGFMKKAKEEAEKYAVKIP